jgi:2-polyprenyl-3-methyl-5-hydroxy-6-metoxy-1,4-benzoquinol methylase
MINVTTCPVCGGHNFKEKAKSKDYTVSQQEFKIAQCTSCELGVTSPRPDTIELGKFYQSEDYISHTSKAASFIDRIYLIARNYTLNWKFRLIKNLTHQKRLLDFGCGTGDFLSYMSTKGYDINGVEPSAEARKKANAHYDATKVYESLSELRQEFDIITLWHVIEHVPDLNQTINELRSRLKPDGLMLIAVPNINSWESTYYGNLWAAYDTPRHLWHFSRTSMIKLLNNHKLKLITTKPLLLDSFYISILSEKYANHSRTSFTGMINAFFAGLKSNLKARTSGEYSSLVYIVRNEDQ